ncbi:unnamed protein product [Prorocentrum cordatum]|uniref:Uncharacterized protein n=1 Tax=Prorocentrum cordatum TaxID=2364126 RepID=A0ABN9V1T0_9DINO|nr:unnamed protein product [Polarella glacialis]
MRLWLRSEAVGPSAPAAEPPSEQPVLAASAPLRRPLVAAAPPLRPAPAAAPAGPPRSKVPATAEGGAAVRQVAWAETPSAVPPLTEDGAEEPARGGAEEASPCAAASPCLSAAQGLLGRAISAGVDRFLDEAEGDWDAESLDAASRCGSGFL